MDGFFTRKRLRNLLTKYLCFLMISSFFPFPNRLRFRFAFYSAG